MFGAEQHHDAGGLGVEGRGSVQHGVFYDGGHFFGGQGQVFVERVHGTAGAGGFLQDLVGHDFSFRV